MKDVLKNFFKFIKKIALFISYIIFQKILLTIILFITYFLFIPFFKIILLFSDKKRGFKEFDERIDLENAS
ncbi:MAG: hypothetical protein C0601_07255 [Candidatus Muiribacterium halophilum]|uniref:Uncharacterized protein n=1 Tax=Muiribacterium halophilum TaxID=2053465 RepID=A0A2N5ZFQ6_MUIH1|nr:MAG: hypothetical protein C0601_07255 [Candidatus Muirbacterium halophilum]